MNTMTPTIPQGLALSDRLQQAPVPYATVLRYSLALADALRHDHENGVVHGVLDPTQVLYSPAGAAIIDDGQGYLTPYVAPEILEDRQPDARSDVFAFGCVVYHLLSGRLPFPGETPEEVRDAILNRPPQPIDAPHEAAGLVRILVQCLEKNPELRWQRIQKVYMELKLLSVAARRVGPAVTEKRNGSETRLRDEIARVERTLSGRIVACDQTIGELQHAAASSSLKLQSALDAQESLRKSIEALEQNTAAIRDMTARLEAELAESARTVGVVEESFSNQLAAIEDHTSNQTLSIEALQTTMAQTDDLLERVVESFDSLQNYILDHTEDAPAGK